ncbi:hypothetical protein N8K70_04030 [Microbacterium betulae]|uniref:Uncharacterized protein n=1 Tax=Microbacterium betulae TaxID=2981139 RepID=A0AA97FIV7_9MICO|nr:hypothetical protein [Microbacterium sp. AB]WOF23860.1 hypothetical protein N8K70_04030 [Microbacterium sp. AB]
MTISHDLDTAIDQLDTTPGLDPFTWLLSYATAVIDHVMTAGEHTQVTMRPSLPLDDTAIDVYTVSDIMSVQRITTVTHSEGIAALTLALDAAWRERGISALPRERRVETAIQWAADDIESSVLTEHVGLSPVMHAYRAGLAL